MKDLLCASPIQRANSNLSLALQDDQPDDEPEDDFGSESFPGSDSGEASGDEGEEIGDEDGNESDGIPSETPPPEIEENEDSKIEENQDEDSEHDSLTAPTLQLGEHTSDEETSEDQRDSQVKGRWMGNFYRDYGKWGKSEKSYNDDMVPKSVIANDMFELLKDIENSFTMCGTIKFLVKKTFIVCLLSFVFLLLLSFPGF